VLALLADGTGAMAAAALGEELAVERRAGTVSARDDASHGRLLPALVRVRLLEALRPADVTVSNAGDAPVRIHRPRQGDAWLGPGATVAAEPGLAIRPGLLRLAVAPYGLVRFVEGTLEISGRATSLGVVLTTTPRAWVDGILRGELRDGARGLREELGAAALRFLRAGPRHGRDHLCDSTHCAVFAGRGPLVTWVTPRRAEIPASAKSVPAPHLLSDDAWSRVLSISERPGPSQFTGHCGGTPLSSHEVWGRGPREAPPCPRHGAADDDAWERLLPAAALRSAFGGPVTELRALVASGVRKTRVTTDARSVDLLYDDLHRALAPSLGWDALPSPPDAFQRTPGGFLARGRGRGHRVGLCLALPPG
jgi:hypothetical protein